MLSWRGISNFIFFIHFRNPLMKLFDFYVQYYIYSALFGYAFLISVFSLPITIIFILYIQFLLQ